MKNVFLALAFVAVLCSCEKEVIQPTCVDTNFVKEGTTVFDADIVTVSDSEFKTSGVDFVVNVMVKSGDEWVSLPIVNGVGGVNVITGSTGTKFMFHMAPVEEAVKYRIILTK